MQDHSRRPRRFIATLPAVAILATLFCWLPAPEARAQDCQDACLAGCPKHSGPFGTPELDRACVQKCLMLDCSESPQLPPVTPPVARPGGGDAEIELVIDGTTPLRALSRGAFAVTAAALPRGGSFAWRLKGEDAAKLEDAHKNPDGIFTMPRSGPARAQASEQTLTPLKPGHVEITVEYTLNDRKATKSVAMDLLPPLLFLHGIASNAESWNVMKDRLVALGLMFGGRLCAVCEPARPGDFYTADFPHPQESYIHQGGDVAAYVGEIVSLIPSGAKAEGRRVVLVAHSMGGLAARAYLQDSGYRGDVAALVTVGTPHRGSIAAQFIYPVDDGGSPPPYVSETLYRNYLAPLVRVGVQPSKAAIQALIRYVGVDLSVYSEGARELAVVTDDMRRLNGNAAATLPRSVRYVFVVGTLPHDVARQILANVVVQGFGRLERNDPVWKYLSGFIERTDGLVDEGSQNLNTLVPQLGTVIRTQAIHCCMPQGNRPRPVNETEQTDVILRALAATGLVGGLAR